MFTLEGCGYKSTFANGLELNRPEGAPHYVLVYYRTSCLFVTGAGGLPCQNHIILLEPGAPHHYRSLRLPHIDDWVHFTAGERGREWIKRLGLPLNRPVPFGAYEEVVGLVRRLQELSGGPAGPGHAETASCLLGALLACMAGAPAGRPGPGHKDEAAFRALRSQLYQQPEASRSIPALAAQLGLSPSRFQHLYRDIFGRPPGEDMALARLERARYLLENTVLPVARIAEDSGYASDTQLIRHFNRYLHTTPARYRKKLRA